MRRYTISFSEKAAEILERIPKPVRGLVLSRLLVEAERLGRIDLVMVEDGDEFSEEDRAHRRGRGRSRSSGKSLGKPRTGGLAEGGRGLTGEERRSEGTQEESRGVSVGGLSGEGGSGGEEAGEESPSPVSDGGAEDWIKALKRDIAERVRI